MKKEIAIEWKSGLVEADITVVHGQLQSVRIVKGKGRDVCRIPKDAKP